MKIQKSDSYVNLLVEEWRLDKQSATFRRKLKDVLMELNSEAQLRLRKEPRLQVELIESSSFVWAFFPVTVSEVRKTRPVSIDEIHEAADTENYEKCIDIDRRLTLPQIKIRPTTRIVLVLGSQMFDGRLRASTGHNVTTHLRDHLGHVLLYLRDPEARNECEDAEREWKRCRAKALARTRET